MLPVKREMRLGRFHTNYDCRTENPVECEGNIRSILSILQAVAEAIESGDPIAIAHYIHPERGIYIDLKAHWSLEKFRLDAESRTGHLNTFYIDTERLRQKTGDITQISIREILSKTGSIDVELFFGEDGEICELRLHLLDHPELNYYLNNPVFIKIDSVWYLYRLF